MPSNRRRRAQSVANDDKFSINVRRSAVSLAVAAALPGGALAQDTASQEPIEEIVVSAFASSIYDSIASKRASDVVSEVVDAGDLSALPDMSIAEALGRLPGVTTVRANGQSTALNIRGMNGGFVQTTLNGREQASSGGGETPTRWVSFDMYPTELIQQAAVYKSPKASLIEGGVAGSVEMKTINPLLAREDHSVNVNLRVGQNDAADDVGADDTGSRITVSYVGKMLDDKFGVALGYATLEQSNNSSMSLVGKPRSYGTNDLYYREIFAQGSVGNDDRDSYMASFTFEPIDTLTLKADYFRTEMASEEFQNGIAIEVRNGVPVTDPIYFKNTNALLGATLDSTDRFGALAEMRTFNNTFDTESDTFGFNADWMINDRISAQFDWSTSEATSARDGLKVGFRPTDPAATGTGDPAFATIAAPFSYLAGNNGHVSITGQAIDNLTDVSLVEIHSIEKYPKIYTDDLESYKLDFQVNVDKGPLTSVEFGYRATDREWVGDEPTFVWGNGYDNGNTNGAAPLPLNDFVVVESFGGSMARFGDYLKITNQQGFLDAALGAGNHDANKTWAYNWTMINSGLSTVEETDAFYLMANFDTEIGNLPISGNLGVRYVETTQQGTGVYQTNDPNSSVTDDLGVAATGYDVYTAGQTYSDTLPSLNLAFHLTENDILRFSAAKVIARPPVQHMRAGGGSWCDTVESGWVGGSCDPADPSNQNLTVRYNVWAKGGPGAIDPFRADQYDLSYEHYFDNGGAATVAVFHKDIESFVESVVFNADTNNFNLMQQDGIVFPDGVTVGGQYETSRMNDQGGYIRGIELGFTQNFNDLPGIFGGLGFSGSYSYTESETSVDGGENFGNVNIPLPGLSENVWTATVWWDIGPFTARSSTRYRDEFINEGVAPGGTDLMWAADYTVTDMQFSYAMDNGIDWLFQINNVTDEPDRTYFGDGQPGRYTTFGTQYFIGLNYRR